MKYEKSPVYRSARNAVDSLDAIWWVLAVIAGISAAIACFRA